MSDRAPAVVAAVGVALLSVWLAVDARSHGSGKDRAFVPLADLAWRVDINAAPAHELTLLPRIGPTMSARIEEDRAANGPFATAEDLARVRGIGPRSVAGMAPFLVTP